MVSFRHGKIVVKLLMPLSKSYGLTRISAHKPRITKALIVVHQLCHVGRQIGNLLAMLDRLPMILGFTTNSFIMRDVLDVLGETEKME